MRLNFLQFDSDERKLYFEQAAERRGLSPVLLEKDFWVSWMLAVVYESPFADQLVFKGGTSLSKVFRLIERFSEDIDLSVSPALLGIDESEVEASSSRTKRDAWMDEMQARCAAAVRDQIQPALEQATQRSLGERVGGAPWLTFEMDAATKSPVVLLEYPATQGSGFAYLKRSVKLEFGSLTDQKPVGKHKVVPMVSEILGTGFEDWQCGVVALDAERTFWEKMAILHVEHHRPRGRPMPERYARHYADVAAMAMSSIGERALHDAPLRDRVIAWKARYFFSGWAHYGDAKPGTFKLKPADERIDELRRDYAAMRDMYFAEPISFEKMMETLGRLEAQINQGRS